MKYLATIKQHYDTSSKSFKSKKEAEDWLNSQNNNYEYTTVITVYNDKWEEVDSYIYTMGEK